MCIFFVRVASAKPDLILATAAFTLDEAMYQQLSDIARHFADIEAMHTYEGTDTVQSLIMGKVITGFSAYK